MPEKRNAEVQWIERSLEVLKVPTQHQLRSGEQKIISVHPAANVYTTLFRAGLGLASEETGNGQHPLPIERGFTPIFTAPTYSLLRNLPLPFPVNLYVHVIALE